MSNPEPPPSREIELVRPGCQPNMAGLEQDLRVNATFDEAVKALTRAMKVRYPGSRYGSAEFRVGILVYNSLSHGFSEKD